MMPVNNSGKKQLSRIYTQLSKAEQQSLLDFAEFLLQKHEKGETTNLIGGDVASEPLDIPRPESESVIKAIKRLSKTYPMVDKDAIFQPISSLMTAHTLQGKAAFEVIDELEILFLEAYQSLED